MINNKLEVGFTYKSLKDICDVLELKYSKSADSRKATLKKIECHYKLERKGNKYTVLEQYNTPKEKEDKRKSNGGAHNSKYDLLMDNLLINWMYEFCEENINISFSELFMENKEITNIPLLTEEYKKFLNMGHEKYGKEKNIRKDLIDVYSEKLRKIIGTCLEIALNRLQKQEIISWEKETMVKYYVGEEFEIADEDLKEEIKQAETEVYEEQGITPFQRKNPRINQTFKNSVCNKLEQYSISSYWKVYSINIINDEKIIQIDNVDVIKKDLTSRFTESIHKTLFNKKYSNKKDNENSFNVIGKSKTVYEWHPFHDTDSLENIYLLDDYFFTDNVKKDIWDDLLTDDEEEDNEDEEEI